MSRICGTEPEPLDAAVASIGATGAEAVGAHTDVSKADEIQAPASATLAACGEGRQCASW